MKKSFAAMVGLLAASALSAFAADIDGTWVRTVGKRDAITEKFVLKSSGNTVTGTFEAGGGKLPPVQISEGKITGSDVSFKVIRETPEKGRVIQTYTGKLDGPWDELRLSVRSEGSFQNPGVELPAQEQLFKKK